MPLGRSATKAPRLLTILAERADSAGIVERPDRSLLAERMGISVHALSLLIKRCVACEALRLVGWDFLITGKPYSPPGTHITGHRASGLRRVHAPPIVPDEEDAGEEAEEQAANLGPYFTASGMEAVTKIIASRFPKKEPGKPASHHVAISLPRVRFVEGQQP